MSEKTTAHHQHHYQHQHWFLSHLSQHNTSTSTTSNNISSSRSTPTEKAHFFNKSCENQHFDPNKIMTPTLSQTVNNGNDNNNNHRHHHLFFGKSSRNSSNNHYREPKELSKCYPSLNNPFLPAFVDFCVGMIEQHGLDFVGIYRVPGNNAAVTSLQKRFDSIRNSYDVALKASHFEANSNSSGNNASRCDVAAYTSALKQFFRTLPDPLFPFELYDAFLGANKMKANRERMLSLKRNVERLPKWNYETMRFLMEHLNKLTSHVERNKMDVRNLAIIFGPTLMRRPPSNNNNTKSTSGSGNTKQFFNSNNADLKNNAADTLDQCLIVQTIITHSAWFFDENAEINKNVPEDVTMETASSNSSTLQLVFTRLNTSLGVNEAKSVDESSDGASSPCDKESMSSPQLRVPGGVRSLVKSEPNIPAQLIAEEEDEKLRLKAEKLKNKSGFGRKLQIVRNIFRKTSSEAKRISKTDQQSATANSLSLSMTSPTPSPYSSKLNSFDKSPPLAAARHHLLIGRNSSQEIMPPNQSSRWGSSSTNDLPRFSQQVNINNGNNSNNAAVDNNSNREQLPPQVPPRKNSSMLTVTATALIS